MRDQHCPSVPCPAFAHPVLVWRDWPLHAWSVHGWPALAQLLSLGMPQLALVRGQPLQVCLALVFIALHALHVQACLALAQMVRACKSIWPLYGWPALHA